VISTRWIARAISGKETGARQSTAQRRGKGSESAKLGVLGFARPDELRAQ
jgi:hypothetical protein